MNSRALIATLLLLAGCYRVPDKLEPKLSYAVQDQHIQALPSPFPPLGPLEKNTPWGIEYTIAQAFSKELDLYRSISTFKRALVLIPPGNEERRSEIEYAILYSYYIAQRYDDALDAYHHSHLSQLKGSFPAYHDFLVIMYDTYLKTGHEEEAHGVLEHIDERYPETAKKLELSTALSSGHIEAIAQISHDEAPLQHLITDYQREKKSVSRAQTLNAFLPGAGYLYVGQKQSALTAFLLNGLFIYAAVEFYRHGYVAAGIITTSFESGWYFGGIYGAGEAAKLYNERIYEQKAFALMGREQLFPVLTLRYGF